MPTVKKTNILTAYVAVFKCFEKVAPDVRAKLDNAQAVAAKAVGKITAVDNSDFLLQIEDNIEEAFTPRFYQAVASLSGHSVCVLEMCHVWPQMLVAIDGKIVSTLEVDLQASVVQLLKNREEMLTLCATSGVELTRCSVHTNVETFLAAVRDFVAASQVYRASNKSLAAFGNFNKCANEFKKLLADVNTEPEGLDNLLGLLKAAFTQNEEFAEHIKGYDAACDAKIAAAAEVLKVKLNEAKLISGGTRDGVLWKSSMEGKRHTLEEVMTLAQDTLLKGPGKRVTELQDELVRAVKSFKKDVFKLVAMNDDRVRLVVEEAVELGNLSQCTCFESQIVRTLQKISSADRKKGITKYMALYAHVDKETLQPQLRKAAEDLL